MKSIMQEASSVAKAVEQGWIKAGRPQEFTVKVFELPKKNFFGFTVKSAKVGIFFTEMFGAPSTKPVTRQPHQEQPRRAERPQPEHRKSAPQHAAQTRPLRDDRYAQKNAPIAQERQPRMHESPATMIPQEVWTDELVAEARTWLNGAITALNLKATSFETLVDESHLTVVFNKPLSPDNQQEKIVFRSISFLMMQSLRHTFKRRLKRLKITAKSTDL